MRFHQERIPDSAITNKRKPAEQVAPPGYLHPQKKALLAAASGWRCLPGSLLLTAGRWGRLLCALLLATLRLGLDRGRRRRRLLGCHTLDGG